MKIFISWSGKQTKLIASCLSAFIIIVLELDSEPFLSNEILKGETWFQKIIENLKKADFGIILLTPKNTLNTWINFEAGALKISAKKVCPMLFGFKPTELPSPLNQFQATEFSKQDIFMLLTSINQINRSKYLKRDRIKQNFDRHWTEFSEEIKNIIKKTKQDKDFDEYPDSSDIKRIEREAFAAMRQSNPDIALFDRKLQELHLLKDYPIYAKLKIIENLSLEIPCNSDKGTEILLENLLFFIAGWDNRKIIEFIGQQHETNGLEWANKIINRILSCLSEIKYAAEEYKRSEEVKQKFNDTIDIINEKEQIIKNSA